MRSHRYEKRRLELLAAHARGTVLDVGYAAMPNPHLLHLECTGLDMLEPPTSGPHYAEYIQGDIADVDALLPGRRFDTIVAGEFIEHMENPYEFLRSMHGLLDADGRLVLSTPNPIGFPVLLIEAIRATRFFYSDDHTYYFLPRWVRRMLERTGYRLLETQAVGLWLPVGYVRWCPVALSYQVIYVAGKA